MANMVSAERASYKKLVKQAFRFSYYQVVIAWDNIRPEMFMPRKQAMTEDKKPVTFNGEPKLVQMDVFTEVLDHKVLKWMTEKDRLEKMDPKHRYTCNLIKNM